MGKSALLNYLWGETIAKVGSGRPVTPEASENETGIYSYDPLEFDGVRLVINDSWGMEADKADKWRKIIDKQIRDAEKSSKISGWFHSIIYCLDAARARLEEFEVESILKPFYEAGNTVVFVLTKSDIASEEEKGGMARYINEMFPDNGGVYEVCNINQTLRGGREKNTFGKEEVLTGVLKSVKGNLSRKIASNYVSQCEIKIKEWRRLVVKYYDERRITTKGSMEKVDGYAKKELKNKISELDKWLEIVLSDSIRLFDALGTNIGPQEYKKLKEHSINMKQIGSGGVGWEGEVAFADAFMFFVPGVNLLWAFFRGDIHRDDLKEKLSETEREFVKIGKKQSVKIKDAIEEKLVVPQLPHIS